MKMTMVLLVATVALLVSADADQLKSLTRNRIIDLTELFDKNSFEREKKVPDVEHLKCGSQFFCKVSDILDNNKTVSTWPKKKELVEHLKKFHEEENVTCTTVLKDVHPNGVKIEMKVLFANLKRCMRFKNFNGTKQHQLTGK